MTRIKNVPYGIGNFEELKKYHYYYVDKTKFIEYLDRFQVKTPLFLRPRRFGKSLLISTISCFYDIKKKDDFEILFGDTFISKIKEDLLIPPNSQYILTLDFSQVSFEGDFAVFKEKFQNYLKRSFLSFFFYYFEEKKNESLEKIEKAEHVDDILGEFHKYLKEKNISYYLFIDEYDHFANRMFTEHKDLYYQNLTHKDGFIRSFFANLKAQKQNGVLAQVFITGVSPLLLGDVSSGFNIQTPIYNQLWHIGI